MSPIPQIKKKKLIGGIEVPEIEGIEQMQTIPTQNLQKNVMGSPQERGEISPPVQPSIAEPINPKQKRDPNIPYVFRDVKTGRLSGVTFQGETFLGLQPEDVKMLVARWMGERELPEGAGEFQETPEEMQLRTQQERTKEAGQLPLDLLKGVQQTRVRTPMQFEVPELGLGKAVQVEAAIAASMMNKLGLTQEEWDVIKAEAGLPSIGAGVGIAGTGIMAALVSNPVGWLVAGTAAVGLGTTAVIRGRSALKTIRSRDADQITKTAVDAWSKMETIDSKISPVGLTYAQAKQEYYLYFDVIREAYADLKELSSTNNDDFLSDAGAGLARIEQMNRELPKIAVRIDAKGAETQPSPFQERRLR